MLKHIYEDFIWTLLTLVVTRCAYIGVYSPCLEISVTLIEEKSLQNVIFERSVISSGALSSKVDCASTCGFFTTCLSFVYNDLTKSCTTYSEIFFSVSDGNQEFGVRYYKHLTNLDTICPSTYTYDGSVNMCFRIDQAKKTRTNAIATCQMEGGHLVKVDSQAKQGTLAVALQAAYNSSQLNKYYISGKKVSGLFKFDDATPITRFYWGSGSNTAYCCIFISFAKNYKWATGDGVYTRSFICEIDA